MRLVTVKPCKIVNNLFYFRNSSLPLDYTVRIAPRPKAFNMIHYAADIYFFRICLFCYRRGYCVVQPAFFNRGRIFTVFFTVVKPAHAAPDNFLLSVTRPCASPIRRSAFSAVQQFGKRIFPRISSELGFCTRLLYLFLSCPARYFFLHPIENSAFDNRRMAVLHIIHRQLTVILFYPLAYGIGYICLLQKRVPFVFFVFKY